jgi:hypothetical protein
LGQKREVLKNISVEKIVVVCCRSDDVFLLTDEKTLDYVLRVVGNGVSITEYMKGHLK